MQKVSFLSKNNILKLLLLSILIFFEVIIFRYLNIQDIHIILLILYTTIGIFLPRLNSVLILVTLSLFLLGIILNIFDQGELANTIAVHGYISLTSWVIIEVFSGLTSQLFSKETNIEPVAFVDP